MKILIAGEWTFEMYEKAIADAMIELGHTVVQLSWQPFFEAGSGRIESALGIPGPSTIRFNRELVRKVEAERPNLLLVWRGTNILPGALWRIRRSVKSILASYNHDDFSGPALRAPVPWHHHLHWRMFLRAAGAYDCHFVKRASNAAHLKSLGCTNVYIMPMWFTSSIHKPMLLNRADILKYGSDITFAGHYEPDGRINAINALVQAGLHVKVFGDSSWMDASRDSLDRRIGPINRLTGVEYTKALCGAKVCLVLLSALNRDTYTRRCFEIPACGRVMLAPRTETLLGMFVEDREACFFSSNDELVIKTRWLLENSDVAARIGEAGLRRVWADGHDILSRVRFMLNACFDRKQDRKKVLGS